MAIGDVVVINGTPLMGEVSAEGNGWVEVQVEQADGQGEVVVLASTEDAVQPCHGYSVYIPPKPTEDVNSLCHGDSRWELKVKAAEEINDTTSRALALCEIAESMIGRAEAEGVFDRALEAAKHINNLDEQGEINRMIDSTANRLFPPYNVDLLWCHGGPLKYTISEPIEEDTSLWCHNPSEGDIHLESEKDSGPLCH